MRFACCCRRSLLDTGWILASSLLLVGVGVVLDKTGAELYANALILAAFPISMLVGDPKMRGERLGSLIAYATLLYGGMLAIARLGEAL